MAEESDISVQFQDALAKTIPIWAAVINSAVKQYRVGNRQVNPSDAIVILSLSNLI